MPTSSNTKRKAATKERHSGISEFQAEIAARLTSLHGGVESEIEWSAMRGQMGMYSPRLDVAVGPFATGELRYGGRFDELLNAYAGFIQIAYRLSNENCARYGEGAHIFDFGEVTHSNWNARCLFAIEIENRVTRKHLMGGAVNAAALGRVGIAVGWTDEKVKAFIKLRSYLLYLGAVGKNTFKPANLLVLSPGQFLHAIKTEESARTRNRNEHRPSRSTRKKAAH